MAAPRVFVSSTYFDLKHVRADLNAFGEQMGLDMVLFEHGDIPYPGDRSLETSCLEEIDKCDIVVSVIGGRAGHKATESSALDGNDAREEAEKKWVSISRREVEHAVELGRQMFFFVDSMVHAEYGTYARNREVAGGIKWSYVDSERVFEFIEYVYKLEINNAVFPFETS